MCNIILSGKPIPKNEFVTCYENNTDGIGFMWHEGKELKHEKGLFEVESAYDYYVQLFEVCDKNVAVHFRFATHGKINDKNCHPFVRGNIGIMHNGIIEDYSYDKNNMTDSERFANKFIFGLGKNITCSSVRNLIEYHAEQNKSRYVVFAHGCEYIFNEGSGIREGDTWYANSSHTIRPKRKSEIKYNYYDDTSNDDFPLRYEDHINLIDYCYEDEHLAKELTKKLGMNHIANSASLYRITVFEDNGGLFSIYVDFMLQKIVPVATIEEYTSEIIESQIINYKK